MSNGVVHKKQNKAQNRSGQIMIGQVPTVPTVPDFLTSDTPEKTLTFEANPTMNRKSASETNTM